MAQLFQNKNERHELATRMAGSFGLVMCNNKMYIPADYETGSIMFPPPNDRRVWLELTKEMVWEIIRSQFSRTFEKSTEYDSFMYMAAQASEHLESAVGVLIPTDDGLRMLKGDGQLHEPDGSFCTTHLPVRLNTDPGAKDEVMSIVTEWVEKEEIALSLLRHTATMLAADWSAGKAAYLVGDGRNGKSVYLTMLQHILGPGNYSQIPRQELSRNKQLAAELIGKAANIVPDGPSDEVRNTDLEKSLIVGEEVEVRMLFGNKMTRARTFATFFEGTNQEPGTSDKSQAMEARTARYRFPNRYEEDPLFFDRMVSPEMTGALLALLIDNFVKKEDKRVMLATTAAQKHEQMVYQSGNSVAFGWFRWFLEHPSDVAGGTVQDFMSMPIDDVLARIKLWGEEHVHRTVNLSDREIRTQLKTLADYRRTKHVIDGVPQNVEVFKDFTVEGHNMIEAVRYFDKLASEEAATDGTTVVDN